MLQDGDLKTALAPGMVKFPSLLLLPGIITGQWLLPWSCLCRLSRGTFLRSVAQHIYWPCFSAGLEEHSGAARGQAAHLGLCGQSGAELNIIPARKL